MFLLREGLNFDINKLSCRRSSKLEFERQGEMIVKSSGEMWARTLEREFVASFLPIRGKTSVCSEIRVWPKYNALQHWHKYLQIIRNLISLWIQPLKESKRWPQHYHHEIWQGKWDHRGQQGRLSLQDAWNFVLHNQIQTTVIQPIRTYHQPGEPTLKLSP